MSTEEQFDFYWKEIFDGLPYNPIEFNVYRFDQSMSLPSKFNKLYDMLKVLALNNQEVMDYLKKFVETFDFKLETTIKDILQVWLNDGTLVEILREAINEEVVEARNGKESLKVRLDDDFQRLTQKDTELKNLLASTIQSISQLENTMNVKNQEQNDRINENLQKINTNTSEINLIKPFKQEVVEARVDKATLREKILSQDGKIQDTKYYVDTKLQGLTDASPKEVFNTLAQLNATYPTGKLGIFLVKENNSTYHYYQGSWTLIGEYMKNDYTGNLETLSKITFTGLTYRDRFAIFNTVDSTLEFPKGYAYFGERAYDFDAQTLIATDHQSSPMGIIIFNTTTRLFRMEWRSTLDNITNNDLKVGYIDFRFSRVQSLFPVFVSNDTFINSESASQKINTLQSDLVKLTTTVTGNTRKVTMTFPSNLDLYINNTYFSYDTHTATVDVPIGQFTIYVYFNIVTSKYELYLYELLKYIPTPSILIDVVNILNVKDNVLKYEGGSSNTTILDNLDYSLPSYLSSGYAKLLSRFKRDRGLDNKIIIGLTTDTHVKGNTTRYSNIENLVKLSHYFKTDYLLHLGDIVDSASSPDDMLNKLSSVVAKMNQGSGKAFMIHGNHDNNFSGQNGLVIEAQLKNIVVRDNLSNITSYHDSGAYEVSDTPNKLTLFFLNSFDFPTTVTGSNDALRYGFGASQLTWLQTRLSSVPNNHKVLFFSHNGFSGSTTIGDSDTVIRNQGALRKLIESFNQSTNVSITQTNISNNPEYYNLSLNTTFATKPTNRIIACFSGHWHWDKNQTVNGVKHYSLISSYIDSGYNNATKLPNDVTYDSIKLLLIDKTTFETRIIGYGGNLFTNKLV